MSAKVDFPIDFVISWVDNSDIKWSEKKNSINEKVSSKNISDASEERYRDFGFFKYLFRSIEVNAPWVNHIFLVTDNQRPKFLDCDYDKVTVVDHREFIPSEYLPTFNSSVIELYLNKITGLSEHFVYFNDDMLINTLVSPTDFFDTMGYPKDMLISSMLQPEFVSYFEVNDIRVVNECFNKIDVIKKYPFNFFNYKYGVKNLFKSILTLPFEKWSSFKNLHIPYSLRKSEYQWLEKYASERLKITSNNKFRNERDINIWLIQDIRYCLGLFSPRSYKDGKYFNFDSFDELITVLKNESLKLIVINDDSAQINLDRELVSKKILAVLDRKFNNKSKFEI